MCTGLLKQAGRLGNARDVVGRILDPETFKSVREIWGLDDEGEFNGVWGGLGVPNLWSMMGMKSS